MPTTPQLQMDRAKASAPTPDTPTMACYTGYETFPKPPPRVLPLTTFGKSKPCHEGAMTDEVSDLLHAQYRLSLLQWNAGTARRQPTQLVTAMCGAFNVVLLQEAADHVPHVSDQFNTYTRTGTTWPSCSTRTRSFRTRSSTRSVKNQQARPHGVSRPWWSEGTYAGHQLEPPRRSPCARSTCTTWLPRSATQPPHSYNVYTCTCSDLRWSS